MARIKETITIKKKETVLNVTNNRITGVKRIDDMRTGIRLYHNGCVGIAGAIGGYEENDLVNKAEDMLRFNLPYPCMPTSGVQKSVDLCSFSLSDADFLHQATRLLDDVKRDYPNFAFSHNIRLSEIENRLVNDLGADLHFHDRSVSVELLMKHNKSQNLIDDFAETVIRGFSYDELYQTITAACDAFEEKLDIAEGRMPVVMLQDHGAFLKMFYSDLNARSVGEGASLFSKKLGQRLFHPDFTLEVNRDPVKTFSSFFDGEGTCLLDNRRSLIANGVLHVPFAAKRSAAQYGFDSTASATMDYDGIPDETYSGICVAESDKDIKTLMNGRKGILCAQASGGDFTKQGEYASPIQTAYLFDGQKLYGRLPQLVMSSTIYDMFGDGFIGVSNDSITENAPFRYLAIEMNVKRLGGWI